MMQVFHSIETPKYNWVQHIKAQVLNCFEEQKTNGTFTRSEKEIIEESLICYDKILNSENVKFATLHNDIHFKNLIYHKGTLKIVDFERSVDAPIAFELDTISKEINYSALSNGVAHENGITKEDYAHVFNYMKKYYPGIMDIPYLELRIAIYDIMDYIRFCDKRSDLRQRVIMPSKEIIDWAKKNNFALK